MNYVNNALVLWFTFRCVHLSESNDEYYYSGDTRPEYSFESDERNLTILETLDNKIYNFISHPQNGTSDEIINYYKEIVSSMKRAADERMDGMLKKWDQHLHLSSQVIFNMGGPSFVRLQMEEIVDKLKDMYKFSDDVVNILVGLHEKAIDVWELLRKAVLFY